MPHLIFFSVIFVQVHLAHRTERYTIHQLEVNLMHASHHLIASPIYQPHLSSSLPLRIRRNLEKLLEQNHLCDRNAQNFILVIFFIVLCVLRSSFFMLGVCVCVLIRFNFIFVLTNSNDLRVFNFLSYLYLMPYQHVAGGPRLTEYRII